MNIGGSKKKIEAHIDSKPDEIAQRFINEHEVDQKYLQTLSTLIQEQINKIKNETNDESVQNY